MHLHLTNLRIVEGDLYQAGYTEDGEPVVVFSTWIEGEDRSGKRYAHQHVEPGHVIIDTGDWSGPVPNNKARNNMNALFDRMATSRGYNTHLTADSRHWTLLEPKPTLEQRWQTESEIENRCRQDHNYIPPSGYSDLAAWA